MKYFLLFSLLLGSCTISFRGVSIPPEVNNFYVGNFIDDSSEFSTPTLAQDCIDGLIDKILKETKLVQEDETPDIEFTGVVRASITSEAPGEGQSSNLDRLSVTMQVEYTDHLDEENNWKSSFTNFENFDPSDNLDAIQEELIASILDNILEDIYQKAFTNW